MTTITVAEVATAMQQAISEVIENMAFLEALPLSEPVEYAPDEAVFFTRLPIYKPYPAMVGLVMPQSMALKLAGSMMMRDFTMEEDEFEVMDVLSELANMLGGSLLTNLLPNLDAFELGLPECRVISDIEGGKEWENATPFPYELEGEVFLTTWSEGQ